MIIINLIQNIALLVALAATYQVIASRFEKKNVGRQILSGLLFGGVGLVGMMTPLNFMPGIIFDGRSIILSVSGLFGGPLVAAIAAAICGAYRLWLGGAGAWVGTSVILESAVLGVVFHFLWRGTAHQIGAVSLWLFGLLVHAVMFMLMLALPGGAGPEVLRQIGPAILIVYPVATMLVCQIFQDYERQLEERKALRESEERYRHIFDNSIMGTYQSTPDGRFIAVNPAYARMFGYGSPEEMVSEVTDIGNQLYANPADREQFKRRVADPAPLANYEVECRRKDGTHFWGSMNARSVRDESGNLLHYEGMTQDITARKKAEEALRKSQALLNSIIEQSPFSMWISDNEGTLTRINPACKKWVRVTDEDVVGKYNVLKDEAINAQGFIPIVRRVFENGEQANFELEWDSTLIKHLEHKEDFKLILSVTIFPVKDAEGRITNAVCQHIDITDRKQAQEALRQSEEQYRAVFDNAGIGIDLLDRDGRIVKVNKALLNILGYAEEELRLLTFLDITHPEDKEISRRSLEALLAGKIDSYRIEKRYLRKDGSIVWVDLWSCGIRDANGKHAGTVAVIEDITERKKAEDNVRESEARYRLLVENVNDAIFVAQDGFVKSPNYRLAVMTGYSLDELTEQPFAAFIHPEDADMVVNRHTQRVSGATEPASAYQFRLLRKAGNPRWVELGVTLIEWEGRPATLNVLRDVTERVQAEEALRQSEIRYKGLFDNMSDAVAVYQAVGDGEDFLIVDFNKSGEQIERVGKEEILGKSVQEVFPGVRELGLVQVFQRVWRTGVPEHLPAGLYKDERLEGWRENFVYKLPSGEIVAVYRDETERETAKQILDAEKKRFEALAETSPFGLAMIRQDGSFEYTNPRFHEIFGYDSSEIPTGREWFRKAFPDPDCRHEAIAAWLEDLTKATQDQLRPRIFTVKCKDGAQKIIHFRPILLPSGEHVVTYEDVTERKRSEEALGESEEKFSTAFRSAPNPMLISSMEDGTVIEVNDEFVSAYGYERSEVLGKTALELGMWKDADERVSWLTRITNKGYARNVGISFFTKDGTLREGLVSAVAIQLQGKPFLLSTFNDITELKKAERELQRTNELLRAIIEAAPTPIAALDLDGNVQTVWNPAAEKMLGWSAQEVMGRPLPTVPVEKQAEFRNFRERTRKGMTLDGVEVRRLRRDGLPIDYSIYASPLHNAEGYITGSVFVLVDITGRKQAEEEKERLQTQLLQAQKMEAIGTLAGGIAHDFNNLLTVVLGFSELLLAEKDEKHPDYADLGKIFHAAKNGAELVQRLLMFSRKSEPKPVPMNLNQQIVQVEKLLRRTIPKMVDINLDLSADLPKINADPSQLEQILMNLAVNARDAMPDTGKLTVRTGTAKLDEEYCRLHVEVSPGRYVVLEVSDTGHGMDKETVEHIFEPFFTTKEMGRGTGLGLAMVYGIVKQHNGHIAVYSEVGKGTIFKVYFPAIPAEVEPGVEETGIMPAFGTETVLLVDDEEFVRELGARILTKQGYTVLLAKNGREGLDLFDKERSRISLVILDLIMPEMGGTECLKGLLKIDPKVQVLIASGFSADASVKETIQMGAKGFVSKPFRMKELLRDVRRVLDATE